MEQVARYVEARGFRAKDLLDRVEFDIPWIHAATGELHVDHFEVRSLEEAKLAIGC